MIKPWLFEFFTAFQQPGSEHFDPAACQADYLWYLEQWVSAEAAGFEGIFFSEHHFVPGRFSPSPNLLIAAVAARTRTLRLGTMGNVVPLYEPWRLAEEYAMLDQLTGGRLEIGLASGSGPREHLAVGLSAEEVRPRFAEALDIIDAALTQPVFTHRGRYWNFDGLSISPRPLQQPLPPRWMTGVGTPAAAAAGQRGYRFCTGFLATDAIAAIFSHYRDALRASGGSSDPMQLGLRRMVVIAADESEGRSLGQKALARTRQVMAGTPPLPYGPAPIGAVADAPNPRHAGPSVADEECIAGDAQSVALQIIEQCHCSGAGHFLGYLPSTLSRQQAAKSLALWCQVIPQLREAKATG
jgi:alkanesulfonate monooxygenase SsuD/methylene tetrahydromethanopterin reductase-like flavin-dependent oxidoreductase (luciferase family)